MDPISLEDLDEVDLLLTELEISLGKGNLVLCIVASPAYRERIIEIIKARFPCRVTAVDKGDELISDLRNVKPKSEEILVWTLPETLSQDLLDALNNFRELFYDAGVPSLIFMTPAGLDDVIWEAPDFWRYRGGYHILKGEDHGQAYQAVEALSIPLDFSYRNKEELLRRKRINEYLLDKITDQKERTKILAELGTVHLLLSEARKAIEYYEQVLAISREIGDRMGEGNALGNLGLAYAVLGDAKNAIEYYAQALAIAREIGDRSGEGGTLGNLGSAYHRLGKMREAIEYYEQHLAIAHGIGDRSGEGGALCNLGLAYAALGDAKKAIEYYEQALAIAREIRDRMGEGNALGNLGNAYRSWGETRKAIEYYEQALAIAREIGDRMGEGNALGNLGLAYADL
ncbi:MAG: tetratricopeptide repeat protein, partial [Methanothrix sp.]|nr:tetratricopeptide repeat protein [Methanothrix sp.]